MKIFTQMLSAAAVLVATTSVSGQTLYDNFETTRLVTYPVAEGVFTQNAPNPGTNYPAGRNSKYTATTATNEWKTLTFIFFYMRPAPRPAPTSTNLCC